MKFGATPITDCVGGVLAHRYKAGTRSLGKGHKLSQHDIDILQSAGHEQLIIAQFEAGDWNENDAAAALAPSLAGAGVAVESPHTGRVNLRAARHGLFVLDIASIHAFNAVDPAITVATLAPFSRVAEGDLLATIKIIPFGVARGLVNNSIKLAKPLMVLAYHPFKVAMVQTCLPSTKGSVLDKTYKVTQARIEALGGTLLPEQRVAHDGQALANALVLIQADMVLVFGASAVADFDDVIPAAIRQIGGHVVRVGMPVDPGNLLVLGKGAHGQHILGAPGCARSPKENGFDWVLARLFAGLAVTAEDIAQMGVGGLLQEIASRPQKREM